MIVKIHEAKTQLSKLIARAEAGEEIVIARDDKPVVKLTPLAPARKQRVPGLMKGKWPDLPDSFFFDPLPEEELKLWEGSNDEDSLRKSRHLLVSERQPQIPGTRTPNH